MDGDVTSVIRGARGVSAARMWIPVRDRTDQGRSHAMGDAAQDRAQAAELPEGDVVRVLLEQHARIRELFADVKGADGEHKQHAFDELRALLAVHETAEEMVLRRVTAKTAGQDVVDARNHEEAEANEVLKALEKLDVSSADFDTLLAEL